MTLMNGLTHSRKAYLWSDTAFWEAETGKLVEYGAKACVGLEWPFAVAISVIGKDHPQDILFSIGNAHPPDLATLLAAAKGALRVYCRNGGMARLLVAAYENGPHLYVIASDGAGVGEPFAPVEMASFTSSGVETKAYQQAVRQGFNPKRMRRVIEAQRRAPFGNSETLASLGDAVWIGGEIIEIEVSRRGVEQRVIASDGGNAPNAEAA